MTGCERVDRLSASIHEPILSLSRFEAGERRGAGRVLCVAATITNRQNLEMMVQSLSKNDIALQLPTTGAIPPGNHRNASHNTNGHFLQTHPIANAATVLLAVFQNDSGQDISEASLTYRLAEYSAPTNNQELPGHHVYVSLTGESNSWQELIDLREQTKGT